MIRKSGQKKQKRGVVPNRTSNCWKLVLLLTICILTLAFLLYTGGRGADWDAQLVNKTQELASALQGAREEYNADTITTLTDHMMRVGVLVGDTLAKMENGDTTPHIHRDILSAAEAYKNATFFLLETLQGVLPARSNDTLLHRMDNNNIVYTPGLLWGWIAVASYALMNVLPEYYFALDDTQAHGEVLVLGLMLLQDASKTSLDSTYALQGDGALVVDCGRYGRNDHWTRFCRSGFNNHTGLEIRRAAILEELIALHPDYAPVRLHYTVTITLTPHVISTDMALALIERERGKLQSRLHVDPLHRVMLLLCEAFVSPTSVQKHDVVSAIRQIGNCAKLFRPFHKGGNSWRRLFHGKQRPDVMDGRQAKRLLNALKSFFEESGELFPATLVTCGGVE